MLEPALGLIELTSIAKGFEVTDTMIKVSEVKLVEAYPVCPGKFIVIVTGTLADVESSIEKGSETGEGFIVDKFIIPNLNNQVISAMTCTTAVDEIEAVGVIETYTVASSIIAADSAVKAADIKLIEIRLAKGLGGKSYFTLTGEVGAVKAAINAGTAKIKDDGMIVNSVVIPKADKNLKKILL